jgi:hypothetical protein
VDLAFGLFTHTREAIVDCMERLVQEVWYRLFGSSMKNVQQMLMEVLPAPLGCMFASMTIEDCEESLATYTVEIDDEGVGIFHGSPGTLVL